MLLQKSTFKNDRIKRTHEVPDEAHHSVFSDDLWCCWWQVASYGGLFKKVPKFICMNCA